MVAKSSAWICSIGSGQEYAGHLCADAKSAEKSAAEQALQAEIFKESPCSCLVSSLDILDNRLAYHSSIAESTSKCPWGSTNPSLESESESLSIAALIE